MKRHEVFRSTYYNSQDVRAGPLLLTIDSVNMERVGEKEKLVCRFKEEDSKLLVVTPTKFDAIALIAGSDDTDWPGVKIVLEAGKASFQGKLVDSISIRAPRKPKRMGAPEPTPPKPPTSPTAVEVELDDEIGF